MEVVRTPCDDVRAIVANFAFENLIKVNTTPQNAPSIAFTPASYESDPRPLEAIVTGWGLGVYTFLMPGVYYDICIFAAGGFDTFFSRLFFVLEKNGSPFLRRKAQAEGGLYTRTSPQFPQTPSSPCKLC